MWNISFQISSHFQDSVLLLVTSDVPVTVLHYSVMVTTKHNIIMNNVGFNGM